MSGLEEVSQTNLDGLLLSSCKIYLSWADFELHLDRLLDCEAAAIAEYEGDGIYFNDGDDGKDVGFTINCGNGLSINETTKALQVNTDDVNLRNRFKTINGNSIFGSGNIIVPYI